MNYALLCRFLLLLSKRTLPILSPSGFRILAASREPGKVERNRSVSLFLSAVALYWTGAPQAATLVKYENRLRTYDELARSPGRFGKPQNTRQVGHCIL